MKMLVSTTSRTLLVLVFCIAGSASAQPASINAEQNMDLGQVIELLRQQQAEMASQRKLLQAQSEQITGLKHELDSLRGPGAVEQAAQAQQAQVATRPVEEQPAPEILASDTRTKQQLDAETEKRVSDAQVDDPTQDLLTRLPGAWRLPGTDAAFRIGGYVKSSAVYNQDPLAIKDRFIVGSIPVSEVSESNPQAQSSITASQSRLNFDMREPTKYGILRAFIEGDFAEDNDTFRLRHAFGQWRQVLAGKTWSTFVDTEASPEEVDFEGLNGRVNVRQSQVRIMPTLGDAYQFKFSLEDPNPQVQNGDGVTRMPDIVASASFQPNARLHLRTALIARQIRAQQSESFGRGVEKEYGWGLSLSGRFITPRFGERDSLLFQLNGGSGIGRYINDLSSVGNFDGVFNPANGELELFDVLAGYASWQHWWSGTLRSNFTFGIVDVDNPGFVSGDAYQRTMRFSSNLLWSPTPRINLGLEYLWGSRENENGADGDAQQLQMAAQYSF
ncbi:MAG: DcaP family trimeric outer membrane transporter [Halieaceae bacterium]